MPPHLPSAACHPDERLRLATPLGVIVGIAVPAGPPDTARLAADLPERERQHLHTLGPARQATFVAGRTALHLGLRMVGWRPDTPILPDDRGAPLMPPGLRGSVSHKPGLAAALVHVVADADPRGPLLGVGIDIEERRPLKADIADRVHTPGERRRLPTGAEARQDAILLHFSVKEAIYKAVDPFVRRYVSFQDAELEVAPEGAGDYGVARAHLTLRQEEGCAEVDANWKHVLNHILATVHLRLFRHTNLQSRSG